MSFTWGKEGFKWSARVDLENEEIIMQARIPLMSYLAVGFGSSMRGTDMIVWRWKNEELVIDNLWSDGYIEPPSDSTDFLKSMVEMSADGKY